jgi:transposase
MDKIDARKLTAEGCKVLRQMVIRLRKQSGLGLKELAWVSGVHPSTMSGWLARVRRQGEASLEERRRGRSVGVGRKLTMADEQWLREHIVGRGPQQRKLPFALWSRPAIKALIRDRFGIEMQDRLVGKYLKRWGFTPQRPVKRALEQRPEEIDAWLRQTYPEVVVRAKSEGGVIFWADETAVKEDANWVRGYAPRGRTPVLVTAARWRRLSMISAISPRGEVQFQIVEDSIDAERFIAFLAALIEGAARKVFLVADNLRVRHARVVTAWLADKTERIEWVFLPPYAPESNPDEYLNRHFKTALRTGPVSRDQQSLLDKAMAFMRALTRMPETVRAYFRHPAVAYAAQGI